MDISLLLTIAGVILGVVSLIYAVYVTKHSNREKRLTYELLAPVPVADVISNHSGFSLKVIYERGDNSSEFIDGAFIQYLRLSNFGQTPITEKDLAQTDPVRIEIIGGNVLDISLVNRTNEACQIILGEVVKNNEITSASINFEFLDHQDGGLLRILTDKKTGRISLLGTVIGMPQGIVYLKQDSLSDKRTKLGFISYVTLQILTLTSTPLLYRYITGSWRNTWLLMLPLLTIVISFVYFIVYNLLFVERVRAKFPESLSPPSWYNKQLHWYTHFPESRRHKSLDAIDEE